MKILFNNAEPLVGRRLFVNKSGEPLVAALTMLTPAGVSRQIADDDSEISVVTEADYAGENKDILAFFERKEGEVGYEAFYSGDDLYTPHFSELHKVAKKTIASSGLKLTDTALESLDWFWQNFCNMIVLDVQNGLVEVDEISEVCGGLLEDILTDILDPSKQVRAVTAVPMLIRTISAPVSNETRLFLVTPDNVITSAYFKPFRTQITSIEGQPVHGNLNTQTCVTLLEECPPDIKVSALAITTTHNEDSTVSTSMTVMRYNPVIDDTSNTESNDKTINGE